MVAMWGQTAAQAAATGAFAALAFLHLTGAIDASLYEFCNRMAGVELIWFQSFVARDIWRHLKSG